LMGKCSNLPVDKLSMIQTLYPSRNNKSVHTEPIWPKPPVIKTFFKVSVD
jgi:hypothetical protein